VPQASRKQTNETSVFNRSTVQDVERPIGTTNGSREFTPPVIERALNGPKSGDKLSGVTVDFLNQAPFVPEKQDKYKSVTPIRTSIGSTHPSSSTFH
jgi:hypothetical protein